jgi:hypothetical protein
MNCKTSCFQFIVHRSSFIVFFLLYISAEKPDNKGM